MRRRFFLIAFIVLAVFGVGLHAGVSSQDTSARGRKYKAPPPTAHIEVTVLKDYNGKPIANAAVVFHPMQGEKDEGNMELKTDEDGKSIIDVIPLGDTVRLQIIAHGYQTYGQDYKVDKDHLAIQVRMKRPGEQYSVYKHQDDAGKDQDKNKDNKDKPSDSSKPN